MNQRGRKSVAAMVTYDLIGNPRSIRNQPTVNAPPPPDHLGEPEKEIWRSVFRDFTMTSQTSNAVLQAALEAHMRARECREAILHDGVTVPDRHGTPRAHPLLATERDARQAFLSGLKALKLDL